MFAARNAFMTPPPGPPTITSLSPTSSNNGGATVTITGTNFVPSVTTVKVGGTTCSATVNSTTQITASFPGLSRGAKTVEVTTPSGTATSTYTYTITPYITGISPSTVYFDYSGGYTISGGNFWGSGAGSVYLSNGGYYGISVAADWQLSFNPGALGVGNYTAQVTAPDGWSNGVGISSIYYPAPSISSVSDGRSGAGSQTGSTITLSGSNFANGTTSVSIGGFAVSASISGSSISFSCPNLYTDGTKTITVTTSGSGNQSASTSVYFWAPRASAESVSYTGGSGTYTMPGWANSVFVVVRGGGGGGGSGSGGLGGKWGGGGSSGAVSSTTWSRSSGTSISWSVGGGGSGGPAASATAGSAGGTTSAAGISAGGGAGGCSWCNGAAGANGSALGLSPAPTGGGAGNSSQPGPNPGSGGGGGNSAFGPYPGIAGRAGAVYFSASQ